MTDATNAGTAVAHFDAGHRSETEKGHYHPTGWIKEDGSVTLCIQSKSELRCDHDITVYIKPDGTLGQVYTRSDADRFGRRCFN